jgi:hypothetical protein
MTSALGLSSVTAALMSLLWEVYNGPEWDALHIGPVAVTAVAPDLVQNNLGNGADSVLQVNLFLHQVTYNAAWRNIDFPSLGADGRTRLKNPPLALDLHYLLTAYASEDCYAEALLGFAVQFLHENPVLARSQIQSALGNLSSESSPSTPFFPSSNNLFNGVISAGLANQIEMIKIMPVAMGREEMAWVWTALKADYRLTFPFQVSAVLIQTQKPATAALPVLTRQITTQPNLLPLATLLQVAPPTGKTAAQFGDVVTVTGANLSGVSSVTLSNARLGVTGVITSSLTNVADDSFQFTIGPPDVQPNNLPAGVYLLSAQIGSGFSAINSNTLPFAVAPMIQSWTTTTLPTGATSVPVSCVPDIFAAQQASLLIGGQEAPMSPLAPGTTSTSTPSFAFDELQSTEKVPVRLRVDGVDSVCIQVNPPPNPPTFTGPSVQVT